MSTLFKPALAARDRPHKFINRNSLEALLVDTFKLRTLLVFGAAIQTILHAILPLRYALVPVGILLSTSIITTLVQLLDVDRSSFRAGAIDQRVTSQLPAKDGTQGPASSTGSLVVFRLGVQMNHPLGSFSPHAKEIGDRYAAMISDIIKRRDELGLVSVSRWRGNERGSNNTFSTDFYFRDAASINRFAHEEIHREAWKWWYGVEPAHIGILHETFVVAEGGYESLYVNCRPVLMGRGSVKCKTDEGEKWMNTLVSADTPALKTHAARLQKSEKWYERGEKV